MGHAIHKGALVIPGFRQTIQKVVEGCGNWMEFGGLALEGEPFGAQGACADARERGAKQIQGQQAPMNHQAQQRRGEQSRSTGNRHQEQADQLLLFCFKSEILEKPQLI